MQNPTYLKYLDSNVDLEDTYLTGTKIECPISFDEMIHHEDYCKYFENYLSGQFYEAALFFIRDVEDFMRIPKSQLMISRSKKIYLRYLSPTAKLPVSVSKHSIESVENYLNDKSNPRMFQKPYDEVYHMLKDSFFKPYISSDYYSEMIKKINTDKKQKKAKRKDSYAKVELPKKITINHIQDILKDRYCNTYFKKFCSESNNTSPLFFWMECEEYKLIPDTGYLKVKANKIYNKYISKESKMCVPLNIELKDKIYENYKNPNSTLFLPAQKNIEEYMEKELFGNFLESDEYKDYVGFVDQSNGIK